MKKVHRLSVGLSLFGVIVEYFDYALYGFLATEITAHFFPGEAIQKGLLGTFAIFAMGSLAKPLGNIIFARISDRYGRVYVIRAGLLGLMFATLGMGLIPSYREWGLWSLVGLMTFRFIQGAVIGGQTDGIRLLVAEHVGDRFKHFSQGIMGAASGIGIYFAAFSAGKLHSWEGLDWQKLYLFGAFLCFCMVFLYQFIQESDSFIDAKKQKITYEPTRKVLQAYKKLLILAILAMGSHGGLYHFFAIFLNVYTSDLQTIFTQQQGAFISTWMALGYATGGVIVGILLDLFRKGHYWWISFLGLAFCCGCLLYFLHIKTFSSLLFFGIGFFLSGCSSPIIVGILKSLPVLSRHRVMGFGHVIGSLILSGTTPLIATKLFSVNEHLPIYWLGFLLALNMGSTYALYRQQRKKI